MSTFRDSSYIFSSPYTPLQPQFGQAFRGLQPTATNAKSDEQVVFTRPQLQFDTAFSSFQRTAINAKSEEQVEESNEQVEESNEQVEESNEQVKESNEQVKESNEQVEESKAIVAALIKVDTILYDWRKNIYRLGISEDLNSEKQYIKHIKIYMDLIEENIEKKIHKNRTM